MGVPLVSGVESVGIMHVTLIPIRVAVPDMIST